LEVSDELQAETFFAIEKESHRPIALSGERETVISVRAKSGL
jgi:hypothetical protein